MGSESTIFPASPPSILSRCHSRFACRFGVQPRCSAYDRCSSSLLHNAHGPLIVKVQTRPTIGIAAARRPGILRSGSVLGKPNGSLALGLHRTPSRPASMAPASAINYGGTSSHSRLVGAGLGPIYVLACWTKRHGAYHRVGEAKE